MLSPGHAETKQEIMVTARNKKMGAPRPVHLKEEAPSELTRKARAARAIRVTTYTDVIAHNGLAPKARGVNIRINARQDWITISYFEASLFGSALTSSS
jgi:hypothetical protein